MGNLKSVKRALEECGANAIVSSDTNEIKNVSAIILPGVGAFADGMRNLTNLGWTEALLEVKSKGMPLLGICLGMQLLSEKGEESGITKGLGLIPGKTEKLKPRHYERIPHVGWNEIVIKKKNAIFDDIPNNADYYFVHSFCLQPKNEDDILATTPYCGQFTSMVCNNNIYGVQFHPEKSQKYGFQLLKNFLRLN
ncbi:imidazole glycerol phosphate synthase subunit HisH [Heliorestis acidaminivorans]|uniref:Imidazole glycerol phosphate synthase subunit HisH n=2 Tax=Heliorestis acidaminivorans TaxID=553427 RepID=A0A6I0EUW1_9FIRM|nr:imidazole glycerol phosphate synthase subunit HisH [Heliorestis acidaminivorans]